MTVARALASGTKLLQHTPSPELDAQVLLAHVLKRDRAWLLAHDSDKVPSAAALRFRWLITRRRRSVPIAYLTHKKEFFGRGFFVNRSVLIPRPETELLVEHALGTIRTNSSIHTVVDVGTGSGCIAVTLAYELPHIKVVAMDSSASALKVARKNAARWGTAERITFLRGNLLEPLRHAPPVRHGNTLLIANLPYLLSSELHGDLVHEPRGALDGGPDGLSVYQELCRQLADTPESSRPAVLLLELHPATCERVAEIARHLLEPRESVVLPDLSGRPRVLRLMLA